MWATGSSASSFSRASPSARRCSFFSPAHTSSVFFAEFYGFSQKFFDYPPYLSSKLANFF